MQLKAEKICKTYKNRKVVNHIDLEIEQGEIVGLLGANGAGKTTSFSILVGLVLPDSGNIWLDNQQIGHWSLHQRAQVGISYLPQEACIFRKLSVEDNLFAVLETMPLSKQERQNRLNSILDEFNIQHVRRSLGYALSGGERRRVEIARALVRQPKFILLDEPFAGVDPLTVIELEELISYLATQNIGVLITDHNVRETLLTTHRAYIMNEGEILASGTPEELVNNEVARQVYLGEDFNL